MQKNLKRVALALSLTVLMGVSIGCGNEEAKPTAPQSAPAPVAAMGTKEIERPQFNDFNPPQQIT